MHKLVAIEFGVEKSQTVIMIWVEAIALSVVFFSSYILVQLEGLATQLLGESGNLIFYINNFTENDKALLASIGFSNIDLASGMAEINTLRFIWIKKFIAVIKGCDIWNGLYEEYLGMLFKFEILLLLVIFFIFVLLILSLNNSYSFRMWERSNYNRMLYSLGLSRKNITFVQNGYILCRNMIGFLISIGLYWGMICYMKSVLEISLNITLSLSSPSLVLIPIIGIVIIGISSMRPKNVFA